MGYATEGPGMEVELRTCWPWPKSFLVKFTGFPGIDLTDMDKAYEEARVSLDELGFTGVMLEPGMRVPAIYPDDAGLYPIYQLCSQRNALVLLTLSGGNGP